MRARFDRENNNYLGYFKANDARMSAFKPA